MHPGKITADGFLGNDNRPLVDIIEADEQRLQSLKATFEDAAEKMREMLQEGRKGLGEPITLSGKWLVRVYEARGFLPCPFEDGIYRKITATVTHLGNQKSLVFSDLSLHLLEKHHFLQGKGSTFRLEPEALCEVLEL
jgi:hypothetical protein